MNGIKYLLPGLVLLAAVGCSDDWSGSFDSGVTDTDVCTAIEGITEWGGPCDTTADCPTSTECIIIAGIDDTQGYCAPECCNFETADVAYCTDVADGEEACNHGQSSDGVNFEPPFYCMVPCANPDDCPTGADCVDSGTGGGICYGYLY